MKYLSLDCEMGGRELKYSLLTAAFVVYDETFNELDSLYLQVKPDDGDYIVCGKAMQVNQINLLEHDTIAIPYKDAKPLLFNFLKNQVKWTPTNKAVSTVDRLVPVGHGVKGDIEHVMKLISWGSWEQFCTYHYVDTSVVLQYLRATNEMPPDIDGGVESLAKYFGISGLGFHDARVDARVTAQILKRMIELRKPLK